MVTIPTLIQVIGLDVEFKLTFGFLFSMSGSLICRQVWSGCLVAIFSELLLRQFASLQRHFIILLSLVEQLLRYHGSGFACPSTLLIRLRSEIAKEFMTCTLSICPAHANNILIHINLPPFYHIIKVVDIFVFVNVDDYVVLHDGWALQMRHLLIFELYILRCKRSVMLSVWVIHHYYIFYSMNYFKNILFIISNLKMV